MAIPVRYSIKVNGLREDDVEPIRTAMTASLKASGWYPAVQHIKTFWGDNCTLWFATDWDDPPLRDNGAEAVSALDEELRRIALAKATLTTPEFEVIISLPQQE